MRRYLFILGHLMRYGADVIEATALPNNGSQQPTTAACQAACLSFFDSPSSEPTPVFALSLPLLRMVKPQMAQTRLWDTVSCDIGSLICQECRIFACTHIQLLFVETLETLGDVATYDRTMLQCAQAS